MTLLWTLFGAIFGAGNTPAAGGTIGLVSFAIAGIIVLAPIGAALGLVGGQWKEALMGGVVGLAVGATVGVLGEEGDLLFRANFGLITGGITGATSLAFCRRVLRLLTFVSDRSRALDCIAVRTHKSAQHKSARPRRIPTAGFRKNGD
jgi:hypothetical protein